MTGEFRYLTVPDVYEIHANQLALHGGGEGVRDRHLLESAVEAAEASFGGRSFYTDLFEVASVYIYHICQNHPFIDGNKRTALASGLFFLILNGIAINEPVGELYDMMIEVASGRLEKEAIADTLRRLAVSK